ncbi:cytochrome P450 [Micromonospora zingiberis]|uniref:cytochrome P450 n=1 Tax=Micromonospora zingiberis TaxID=2053011 RepID=UPI0013F41D5A|nr:cytochrome P450 [Micromonospora zingiberis]
MTTPVTTLPPGPRLPAALQTYLLWRHPERFLNHCRQRYGSLFTLRAYPYGVRVDITEPADIRAVFKGDPKVFHAGEGIAAALGPMLGDHSLLRLDEEEHHRQRRPMMRPFRGETMRSHHDEIVAVVRDNMRRWPIDRPFALHPRIREITIDVIIRSVLGSQDPTRQAELRRILAEVLEMGVAEMLGWRWPVLGLYGPWRRHRRMFARLEELLHEEVRAHRRDQSADRPDVLSVLLRTSGDELTDAMIRDHLVTLLIAGYETTSTALAWTFECVVNTAGLTRTLTERVDAGDEEYVEAVVRESLRIRPIFYEVSPRRLTAPVVIGGYRLPAGTMVTPSIGMVHRSAEHYPEPDDFRPERWLGKGQQPPWFPFGGGTRRCLGADFALYEMRLTLATVMAAGELRPAPGPRDKPRPRHVVIVPSRGARVCYRPRDRAAE